jgi:hypothetical protein
MQPERSSERGLRAGGGQNTQDLGQLGLSRYYLHRFAEARGETPAAFTQTAAGSHFQENPDFGISAGIRFDVFMKVGGNKRIPRRPA